MQYERDAGGRLTRSHDRSTLSAKYVAEHYPYREELRGWPEHAVYWLRPYGPARGMAPMSGAARMAMVEARKALAAARGVDQAEGGDPCAAAKRGDQAEEGKP